VEFEEPTVRDFTGLVFLPDNIYFEPSFFHPDLDLDSASHHPIFKNIFNIFVMISKYAYPVALGA